jgi:hypothetical protein
MIVDQSYHLQKGLYKDHTWEWIVSCVKDIDGQENSLDLMNEQFSIIPHFSNICQFKDKFTPAKQWTGAKYQDIMKVWLPAVAPLVKGHSNQFKFIKSVTDFILIASYDSHTNTTFK